MRIAILSDIHGNSTALDAVLSDIFTQGEVDAYLILGDLIAIGPDPNGVLERFDDLPNIHFVYGNTDRYVVTGERPYPSAEEVVSDVRLLSQFAQVAHCFAWTQGAITAMGRLDWLASLPLEQRLELPDGTRLLGVHVSPGENDGYGVHPGLTEAELQTLLTSCEADLVCVGHSHWTTDVNVNNIRVVNPGSVSNPLPPDLRASYAILEANKSGYELQHRKVAYEYQAVIDEAQRVRHPAVEHITRHMLGQYVPHWA